METDTRHGLYSRYGLYDVDIRDRTGFPHQRFVLDADGFRLYERGQTRYIVGFVRGGSMRLCVPYDVLWQKTRGRMLNANTAHVSVADASAVAGRSPIDSDL